MLAHQKMPMIVKYYQTLSKFSMIPHHSDQMSQRSQHSGFSQSVNSSVTQWRGHLFSCSGRKTGQVPWDNCRLISQLSQVVLLKIRGKIFMKEQRNEVLVVWMLQTVAAIWELVLYATMVAGSGCEGRRPGYRSSSQVVAWGGEGPDQTPDRVSSTFHTF